MSSNDYNSQENIQNEVPPMNIFEKIMSFFLGGDDPDREKKRLLKEIEKQLKKSKFKFYKPKGEQAQPQLAKFIHGIYKIVGPAQALIEHADSSGVLKNIIIESALDKDQLKLLNRLGEKSIAERAQQEDTKKLAKEVKDDLVNFFSAFDIDKVKKINMYYNLLRTFIDFIHFDYYFTLKKFDSNLPENDFVYNPRFEAINGEYISDDLKDFNDLMILLDPHQDWEYIFDILQEYRNVEVVNRGNWKKLVKYLQDIKKSRVLLHIIQHIDKDPYYKETVQPPKEKIVEPYLSKLKTQTELAIQKIAQAKKKNKEEKLAKEIFGTTAVSRMKNYTDKANVSFSKKNLGGYIHVTPVNYLKAFLLDFLKRDIKQVVDLFLIKGQWSTTLMSQQLSESFHSLMETSTNLTEFDDSLAEDGEMGLKMKNLLIRADKDKNAMASLRQVLKQINDQAHKYITTSAQNFIVVGKSLKNVYDDHSKQPHELILNWKEIEMASEEPIAEQIIGVYKKIYYFVQLLQMFVK
ncbi:MAG: DUF5312 family protein [Spirochaetia bacterium]